VVAKGTALEVAQQVAWQIAAHAPLAVRFAKQAVDRAVSIGLTDGLALERRLFHLSFATGEFQPRLERYLTARGKASPA
jgi:enoyl-CoA hydratase